MPASVADFTSECTVAFAGTRNKFFSVERTAMSTTPQFGILTGMRKMTEQRTAINGYFQFFQHAVPGNVMGGAELSSKVLGYAERNVASTFEFAQRLVQVKDVQDLAKLQMEFIQSQMQAMTEQAKDLSETATKSIMESAKIPTKGGPSF
jgi:phasin family protein